MKGTLKPRYRRLHSNYISALVPSWGMAGNATWSGLRQSVDGFVLGRGIEASARVIDLPDRIRSRGGEGAIVYLCTAK